jgi:hypothetical protein
MIQSHANKCFVYIVDGFAKAQLEVEIHQCSNRFLVFTRERVGVTTRGGKG